MIHPIYADSLCQQTRVHKKQMFCSQLKTSTDRRKLLCLALLMGYSILSIPMILRARKQTILGALMEGIGKLSASLLKCLLDLLLPLEVFDDELAARKKLML